MLEVTGVSKYYGALAAVRHVSFTARPGEVLGYLGPNGSGKSTTVNMVAGLLEPTDGEIRVHGENIRHVFWLLMAGGLTELLLYRFHKVPFACGYVPGKANVKYLWPVYALVLTAYAYWTARLELWILTDPVRWSIGCATLGTCLALAIAYRRRMLRSSNPLTYEEEVEAAVQVLGVMRT